MPVLLLGTENIGGGGWMAIVVVVCGKICVKICGKIGKNCQIRAKIGVVVDMDPMIMIVVTKRQKDKIQKGKNTKRQKDKKKDKKAKMQKDQKAKRQKGKKAKRQKY